MQQVCIFAQNASQLHSHLPAWQCDSHLRKTRFVVHSRLCAFSLECPSKISRYHLDFRACAEASRVVLQETGLLPHVNAGVLSRNEFEALKTVSGEKCCP